MIDALDTEIVRYPDHFDGGSANTAEALSARVMR
jgi:hypothetical protein